MQGLVFIPLKEVHFQYVRKQALIKDIRSEIERVCTLAANTVFIVKTVMKGHKALISQINQRVHTLRSWMQHPKGELICGEEISLNVLEKLLGLETLMVTTMMVLGEREFNASVHSG